MFFLPKIHLATYVLANFWRDTDLEMDNRRRLREADSERPHFVTKVEPAPGCPASDKHYMEERGRQVVPTGLSWS